MKCIFCEIASSNAPSFNIYEDNEIISFLDLNPRSPGHTLVIPKAHYENFSEMTPAIFSAFFSRLQIIAMRVEKALGADGYNLICNNGRAAGQTVFHCHFHIIPRFYDDNLRFKMPILNYDNQKFKSTAELIKNTEL
ncbi:MAG: HIT family protein [Ignavibacteriaceae bacterium]|nr:HIT family protein [Ignavibacteriaceae bacterium]